MFSQCSERPRTDTHRAFKECSHLPDCISCVTTSFECQYCSGVKTVGCVLGGGCKESPMSNSIPTSYGLKTEVPFFSFFSFVRFMSQN